METTNQYFVSIFFNFQVIDHVFKYIHRQGCTVVECTVLYVAAWGSDFQVDADSQD